MALAARLVCASTHATQCSIYEKITLSYLSSNNVKEQLINFTQYTTSKLESQQEKRRDFGPAFWIPIIEGT